MTGPGRSGASDPRSASVEDDEARRRRLRQQVFGDVLPDTTADEREPGAPENGNDDWLRSNVPPHHG